MLWRLQKTILSCVWSKALIWPLFDPLEYQNYDLGCLPAERELHPPHGYFRGQPVADAKHGASMQIQHCRLSWQPCEHLQSWILPAHPIGTSLHAPGWVGRPIEAVFTPCRTFFLAGNSLHFLLLSTICSVCEHGMPSLILLSWLGSTLGSSSLGQALQKLWLHLYSCLLLLTPFPVWIMEMLWSRIEIILTF